MQTVEDQRAMFGTTIEEMEREWTVHTRMILPPTNYIVCILSDVQEAMSHGDIESARQWVNKSKYYLLEKFPNVR